MRSAVSAVAPALLALAIVAGSAAAASTPPPGDLWSRFPLEPRSEPLPETPRAVTPPPQVVPPPADARVPATWILLGVGGAAAAVTSALFYGRRRTSLPKRAGHVREAFQSRRMTRRVLRPTPHAAKQGGASRAVANPPPPTTADRFEHSLLEILSPRLSLDERVDKDDARETSAQQSCEIQCLCGNVKSWFYVLVDPGLGNLIESQSFQTHGSNPLEQSDAAVAAHEALVAGLVADGWERDGRGAHWFSDRFRRVAAPAGSSDATRRNSSFV